MDTFIICVKFAVFVGLALVLTYLLYTLFLYAVYKLDGGKMGIVEYFKVML